MPNGGFMKENKMGVLPIKSLVWTMGLPMLISMVLQAIYNVVDTAFVVNMSVGGYEANIALGYAFPIQILMIAVGVGLGIGVNALISKSLGEGDKKKASKAAYNGIIIALIFYLLFLIFGLFFTKPFITMQAKLAIQDEGKRETIIKMGSEYLTICCTLSIGQMLFVVFERLLQSSGRNTLSMIGQIAGALTNIILDYVFIYPCNMGVAGAAYATVIGQFVSFILDLIFHFIFDKDIDNKWIYLKLDKEVVKNIFLIGIPAMIMQALLSIMMFMSNLVLTTSKDVELLQSSFSIYYKIQQIALFAFFGISNALISLTSYNYGKGNKDRLLDLIKHGLICAIISSVVITILFEILAKQIASLFSLSGPSTNEEVAKLCIIAIRIASIGFIFMSISICIQGILQGLREIFSPLIISILRLVVILLPFEFLFLNIGNPTIIFWIAFPVTELITSIISIFILYRAKHKKIDSLAVNMDSLTLS